jgi:hypothetical protein
MPSASDPEWFYTLDGNEQGPITSSQLRDLVATGRLCPTDGVRRKDMASAVPAARVKGLFPNRSEDALAAKPSQHQASGISLPQVLHCDGDLPPEWSVGEFQGLPKMFENLRPALLQGFFPLMQSGEKSGGIAGLLFAEQAATDEAYGAIVDEMGKQFCLLVGLGDKARYTFTRTEPIPVANMPAIVCTEVAFTRGISLVHIRMIGCMPERVLSLARRIDARLFTLPDSDATQEA